MTRELPFTRRRALAATLAATAMVFVRRARAGTDGGATAAAPAPVPAPTFGPEDTDRELAEISRARASMKTLTGPFTQVRTIGLLATKVTSTGTLTLVRPDRLRWELAPPDDIVYWVTPDGLAYKSARGQGRMPSVGGKLAAALEDIRSLLGGDINHLRERYDLKLVARDANGVTLEGIPKPGTMDEHTKLEKIIFSLDKDRVRPTHATLVETARDKTDITFGKLDRDLPIDPARMRAPF